MNEQCRTRQGKKQYIFEKDWEEGYDPLKPYIEMKDADGKVTQKRPASKSYNVCDMKDEELDDFLGEEEKKSLKEARRQLKESKGRDLCKEYHEKKKKDEQENMNILEKRNQILEDHARQLEEEIRLNKKDFADYKKLSEQRFEKLTNLFLTLSR